MNQRINPIGPADRGAVPVQRVERRRRTPEEHEPGDGHEAFDEELEREMRERESRRQKTPDPADEPEVVVDLSDGRHLETGEPVADSARSGVADSRYGDAAKPHRRIDISV